MYCKSNDHLDIFSFLKFLLVCLLQTNKFSRKVLIYANLWHIVQMSLKISHIPHF